MEVEIHAALMRKAKCRLTVPRAFGKGFDEGLRWQW